MGEKVSPPKFSEFSKCHEECLRLDFSRVSTSLRDPEYSLGATFSPNLYLDRHFVFNLCFILYLSGRSLIELGRGLDWEAEALFQPIKLLQNGFALFRRIEGVGTKRMIEYEIITV